MPATENRERGAKIIPFPKRPRAKPLRDKNNRVDRDLCVLFMGEYASVPQALVDVLGMPAKLYQAEERFSFSSDPKKDVTGLVAAFTTRQEITAELIKDAPDYVLDVSYRGNSSFCMLLDKKRGILVFEELGNVIGAGLSWHRMADAIKETLQKRDMLKAKKEKFDMVIFSEVAPKPYVLE